MLGSRNNFFSQDLVVLKKARTDLERLLLIKRRSKTDIQQYLKAYDYFVVNPKEYDGATIVKDLVDVRTAGGYLDADAMLHDFDYLMGANLNFVKKWKADKKYIIGMEMNGKGVRVTRMIILTLIGIIFVPYKYLSLIHI